MLHHTVWIVLLIGCVGFIGSFGYLCVSHQTDLQVVVFNDGIFLEPTEVEWELRSELGHANDVTEKDSKVSVGDVAPTYNPTGPVGFAKNVGRPYVADGRH